MTAMRNEGTKKLVPPKYSTGLCSPQFPLAFSMKQSVEYTILYCTLVVREIW